jgi:hypothetical protein
MEVHRNYTWKKSFRNYGRQSEDSINMAVAGIRGRDPPSILGGTLSSVLSTQDAR